MASSDESDAALSDEPGAGDSIDQLLGAAVHAPAVLPELTVGDELRGRFRIERLIGVGGMGSVYLATDTTLERPVAIKLHHSVGAERLHREAIAMARLAHPNVIAVFEVGEIGEHQAFVAMEYVAGTTLRAWAAAAPRTVRDRIAMLEGAGAGLAAAHAVGLVHRDFKPENILVGDDGRPRVGDFGLARAADAPASSASAASSTSSGSSTSPASPASTSSTSSASSATSSRSSAARAEVDASADTVVSEPHAPSPATVPLTLATREPITARIAPRSHPGSDGSALATPLTQTGAVLGTPAYMAPEQAGGGRADARADQFAFCVVAWELLYGARPFAGATLGALVAAAASPPRPPGPQARKTSAIGTGVVRASLRRVLERGLAADPARRFADMPQLLRALRRAARSRVPLAIGGAAIAAAGAVAIAFAMSSSAAAPPPPPPSCASAGADAAAKIPRDLPARMRATGAKYAPTAAAISDGVITAFADRYKELATTACRAANIEHAWSPDLLSRATTCLAIRVGSAAAMLSPDRVTTGDLGTLIQLVQSLPELGECVDPASLAAAPAAPPDPARLRAMIAARAALDASMPEAAFEADAPVRAKLADIAAGPIAGEPAIAARIHLLRGELALHDDRYPAALGELRDAYYGARAIDDIDVEANAAALLIHTSADVLQDPAAAEEWIRAGVADAQRGQSRARRPAAQALVAAAYARLDEDKADEATRYATQAVALVATPPSLVLFDALSASGAASCAAGRFAECYATEDRALALVQSLLGDDNPRLASILADMALDHADGDPTLDTALALAHRAKAIADRSAETSSLTTADTETTLATLIYNTDTEAEFESAYAMLADARTRKVAALGGDHPDIALIDMNIALYDTAFLKPADAAKRLASALAIQERAFGPTSPRVGQTLYNLAATLRELKRYPEGLAAALRASDIFARGHGKEESPALATAMAAAIEYDAGHAAQALAIAERGFAIPVGVGREFGHAWCAVEAARAIVALHGDGKHARALLAEARATFVAQKLPARIAECDQILARVH